MDEKNVIKDMAGVKKQVEWCAVTEMDQKQNFSAAALLLPALSTPPSSKSSFSTSIPSQAQRRVIRVAKKRKRSIGDLSRRRQRLLSFQLEHTPPSTPHKLEPETPTLESVCWGGFLSSGKLDSSSPGWIPQPTTWPPQSWCPPGWMSPPLPIPCLMRWLPEVGELACCDC